MPSISMSTNSVITTNSVKSSIWSSLCLANVLVCILGLVMMGGGVWIVLDYQDSMEVRQEMMEEGDEKMKDYLKTSLDDFYSYFNKEGGWLNLGCVTIGIGAFTFIVSIFGFCGVHEKSVCLLFIYIVLILIGMVLQVCSAFILFNRGHEMKAVSDMLNLESDTKLSSGKCYEKMIFFLLSGSFSTVVMILLILLTMMMRQAEGFKHLAPV